MVDGGRRGCGHYSRRLWNLDCRAADLALVVRPLLFFAAQHFDESFKLLNTFVAPLNRGSKARFVSFSRNDGRANPPVSGIPQGNFGPFSFQGNENLKAVAAPIAHSADELGDMIHRGQTLLRANGCIAGDVEEFDQSLHG